MVKVICHKAASLLQAPGGRFIGTTWRIRLNLCLLRPTRVYNPNGKSTGSAGPFVHSSRHKVSILYNGPHFSQKLPFLMGIWTPCNTCFLEPTRVRNPNGIWIGSAVFSTAARPSVPILCNGTPLFPSKLPIPVGGSGPHLIHGFLGPYKSSTQTASRSVQPFLHGSLV